MSGDQLRNGSKVLKFILALSDKHQVPIRLEAVPYGKGLSESELRAWYKRHGFKGKKGMEEMVRKPM